MHDDAGDHCHCHITIEGILETEYFDIVFDSEREDST